MAILYLVKDLYNMKSVPKKRNIQWILSSRKRKSVIMNLLKNIQLARNALLQSETELANLKEHFHSAISNATTELEGQIVILYDKYTARTMCQK